VSRSEIVRVALRRYLEEEGVLEAIKVYQKERKFGSLKKLTSLADLAA
jgi:metal-responsive CopG/Arc/MetJ family transcriptional regulator